MHAVDRQARQNLKKARLFRARFLRGVSRGRSQAHQLHGSRVRLVAGYRSCVTCLNFARAGAWNLAALCRRIRPCTHRATTTSTCLLPVQNHSCSENAQPIAVDDATLLGIVRRLSRVLAFSAGISRKCPCGGTGRRARTQNRVPQGVLVRFRPGAPRPSERSATRHIRPHGNSSRASNPSSVPLLLFNEGIHLFL